MNNSTISKCLLANENDLPKTLSLLSVLAKANNDTTEMEEYTLNESASSCDCSACETEDPVEHLRLNKTFLATRKKLLVGNEQDINSTIQQYINNYNALKTVETITLNPDLFMNIMIGKDSDDINSMSCDLDLNDEEMLAIERIKKHGFAEQEVLQVYFACEKNEENSILYLNEHK